MTTETKPLFTVLKGDPSPEEMAALTAAIAQLSANARKAAANGDAPGERNLWGRASDRFEPALQFNPNAFRNVRYY